MKNENKEIIEEKQDKVAENKKNASKKAQIWEMIKFLLFSLSAGAIQILSFELLYTWTACLSWWPSYLISILLSVVWNFTFNRKFTFQSSCNVPISMLLVLAYYSVFIPVSVFGGRALEAIGWNGTLVTLLMMVLNFVTEYIWQKFVVFNEKIVKPAKKKELS